MRTLSTSSKLLAYVAAALGVLAALSLPWFAGSPKAAVRADGQLPTFDGPVEEFFAGVARWVTASDGVSASQAFAGADIALMALVAVGLIGAALAALRATEQVGRWLIQAAAFALAVLVTVKLFQVAGSDGLIEMRRGGIIALACSTIMFVTAGHVAQQGLRRRAPEAMSALHDPALRSARPGSFAPPGA